MSEEELPKEQDAAEIEPVEAAETAVEPVADAAEQAKDAAEDAVGQAKEAVEDAAETVVERGEDAVAEAADKAAEVAEEATAEVSALDEKVEEAVKNVAKEAREEERAAKRREKKSVRAKKAKQAKDAWQDAASGEAAAPKAQGRLASLGVPAWIAISVASLALGLVVGRFALGGGANGTASLVGKTTVSEAELGNAYATYNYEGTEYTVTIQDAIEQGSTLADAQTEDGNYTIPSAEYALSAARNAILAREAESNGITVSDEDLEAYAEEAIGTSDLDAIAEAYGMEVETVKELLYSSAQMSALRDKVVSAELPELPEAPEEAEEGKEDEQTEAYAAYIISLAGDEWDADAKAWASEDGAYATALADADFSAEKASYNAAETAYYVAYQLYTEAQTDASAEWTEFVNGLLSNSSIEIASLVS